jgi:hypothetical protein
MVNLDPFQFIILPSFETWFPKDEFYYIVLGKSFEQKYRDFCDSLPAQFPPYFCSRIRPIFVDCPEGHWGDSPCCKQEQGLIQMYGRYGQDYDFFLYGDDDNYFRISVLQGILEKIDPSEPIIATAGGERSDAPPLGKTGYLRDKAPYQCSKDPNMGYPWGQPVIYSRAALSKIQSGLILQGLTKECQAFDITHDTGNAVFHYMYSLPEVRFGMAQRQFRGFTKFRWNASELLGFHAIKATDRSFQKDLSMKDVHNAWIGQNATIPKLQFHRPTGFTETNTYRKHGDPTTWTEWDTFTPGDCG